MPLEGGGQRSKFPKYVVTVRNSQGVQFGDGNSDQPLRFALMAAAGQVRAPQTAVTSLISAACAELDRQLAIYRETGASCRIPAAVRSRTSGWSWGGCAVVVWSIVGSRRTLRRGPTGQRRDHDRPPVG